MTAALRDLRSGRPWLAALAASLLAFGLSIPLGIAARHLLLPLAPAGFLNAAMLAQELATLALVEGCKVAALWWLLRRDGARWLALGIAYGTLAGVWFLLQWLMDWLRFPGFVTPSLSVPIAAAALILFHGLLGLLAQGLARAPGRLLWGWAGASLMGFVLLAWPTMLAVTIPLSESLLITRIDALPLSMVAFALGLWAVSRHGPRHLALLCLAVIVALAMVLVVLHQLVPIAGVRRSDPAAVAVAVLGACALAAMVTRQALLPWMRGDPRA